MRASKKYSALNIIQFGAHCNKRFYTKCEWIDFRRNVRHVIDSLNKYECGYFYHEAEKNLKILQGAFSVLREDRDAFNYTLDLSTILLEIKFKACDRINGKG